MVYRRLVRPRPIGPKDNRPLLEFSPRRRGGGEEAESSKRGAMIALTSCEHVYIRPPSAESSGQSAHAPAAEKLSFQVSGRVLVPIQIEEE